MAGSQSNFDVYVDANVTLGNMEGYGDIHNNFDVKARTRTTAPRGAA